MNNKLIIVVSGLPCVGKSTVAEAISKKYQLPLFSVDPIESSILESGIKRSFETGYAAYLVAKNLASEQLKLGLSVVIDAVNPVKEARDMWEELSKKYNAKVVNIECVLAEDEHKKRVDKRTRGMIGMPEVTWDYVQKIKAEYLPLEDEKLIINTAVSLKENLEIISKYIDMY